MNLPNKITVLRVCLIPIFLVVFLIEPFGVMVSAWVAVLVFSIAAITDAIDGHLARKYKLITNFGKLMDPLADKLLVCSAFVAFAATGLLPAWAVILLISREFYISGLRQLALEQRIVVAASNLGKFKTITQIVLTIYVLLPPPLTFFVFDIVIFVLVIITVIFSIVSAVDYTIKNKQLFTAKEF
ncbi:MAG: CDP-diacylglycerol--glycerol-3-phosphate 3-phosphatidyltransferase [Defluviitaleaceae bacterium]|nr:CDP-diacylglycerol--glycerol-3-phosphate 3-phosphatidyltransferase [Defluviitaleaceae bacterium]